MVTLKTLFAHQNELYDGLMSYRISRRLTYVDDKYFKAQLNSMHDRFLMY